MKRLLFILVALLMDAAMFAQPTVHVNNRDTVRYGDPWYTFNPMPTLLNRRDSIPNFLFYQTESRLAQAYSSDKNTLYGIAVTINELPDEELNAWLFCWRGVGYHRFYHPGYDMDNVRVDSIQHSDSISTWNPPLLKKCVFEYQLGESAGENTYKGTLPCNCFEFYFDTPLPLTLQDTFFIGGYSGNSHNPYSNGSLFRGVDTSGHQKWMLITILPDTAISYSAYYNFNYYPTYKRLFQCGAWGVVFPITELRCTRPRGLEVDSAAEAVRWEQDADAERFQLAVCRDTLLPDEGIILTTTDLQLPFSALPALSPDSVYRLYLRKQCDFSTSRTRTVWSDWSDPVTVGSPAGTGGNSGIGEARDGVKVSVREGVIVVEREGGELPEVTVCDVLGRCLWRRAGGRSQQVAVPAGIYTVRVGDSPARKVTVLR